MADEISAAELHRDLRDYHNEIVALARETTSSVEVLRKATAAVNNSKPTFWKEYKGWIVFSATLAVVFLFIFGIAETMSHTNLCVVNVGDGGKSATITSCKNITPNVQKTVQTPH